MNLPHWLTPWKPKPFPEPKSHNLTLEQILFYWSQKLKPVHRSECAVIVYRMDPAKAPVPSMVTIGGYFDRGELMESIQPMMPGNEWRMDHLEIERVVFCVRIQRTWKQDGRSHKREMCISTFSVPE